MAATSLTLSYDAVLSTTLFNARAAIIDGISRSNFLFYKLMKSDNYKSVSSIGDRAQIALMYELGAADAYSGYDILDTTPIDGVTSAFFSWCQMAAPISISRLERRKNNGENQLINLLQTKTKQALMGIQEKFAKAFGQGNGINSATDILTPYTSPVNGATFIDPINRCIAYDPTASYTIGGINQSSETWWRNKTKNSVSTTYAAFLKEMDNLYNSCTLGGGGDQRSPDIHISDQSTFEMYCAALRSQNRYTDYRKADIPFEAVAFHGHPLVWDEYVCDVQGGSTTQSTTSGTWFMANSNFLEIQYDSETNFISTNFITPENQDASTAHILWLGAVLTSNRRKHGVAGGIDTTIAS